MLSDAVSFSVQIAMRKKRKCLIFIIKCICVQNVVVLLILSQNFVAIVYQKTEHVCTPYLNNKTCFTEAERSAWECLVYSVCAY